MLITWISTKWNRKCGRLLLWSSSHAKFYMDFGVEMFNKVRLTYFTRLRSCGNSFTLFKGSDIGWTKESYQNCVDINQVLGGSESVMWSAYCIHSFCVGELIFLGAWVQLHFPSFWIRPVAGGGAGGARAPPEIFRLELNSATKVEFFY